MNLTLPWHIYGQPDLIELLERDFLARTLSHTTLVTGPTSTGKFTVLKRLAQFMHCPDGGCLSCNTCRQIHEESHIDTFIFKNDGNPLGIKEFRELKSYLSLSAQNEYKIVIIQDLERLSDPLKNSMLKILEEPPKDVYFFLTSSNPEAVLETIISRARVYKAKLATNNDVKEYLSNAFKGINQHVEENVLFFAGGRIGMASRLIQDEEMYQNHLNWLSEIEFLYENGNEFEALKLAEKLSELDKDGLRQFLALLTRCLRAKMLNQGQKLPLASKNLLAKQIEQVYKCFDDIDHNVNVKISLEVLFLHCFKRLGNITNQ